MWNRVGAALAGAGLGLLLSAPGIAVSAARDACRLWAANVLPALFPFLVLSQWMASRCMPSGDGGQNLPLLRIPARMLWLLPLGWLGGSPAGAKLIAQTGARTTLAQRRRLAVYCATCSPMFALGTVSDWLRMPGGVLLAAHVGGALITGMLLAPLIPDAAASMDAPPARAPLSFGEAVTQAALAMLTVCGCMMLCCAALACAVACFPMDARVAALLACVLEMASGCARTAALPMPAQTLAPWVCATLSFGGLSVFLQNATFLRPAGVPLGLQFGSRLLHAGISYALCRALLALL